MEKKKELFKVLCDIEKEVKDAKELCGKQELTTTEEIEFRFHLSQIQEFSKSIRDILNS